MLLELLTPEQRVLHSYLKDNWIQEDKGTLSKGFRFIKTIGEYGDRVSITVYFHQIHGSKKYLVIAANGYWLKFNPNMSPETFNTIVKNIK